MTVDIEKAKYDFKKQYLSPHYRADWNKLNFSGTSKEHQRMIFEICWWLHTQGLPFLTEARFKTGYRPDVVVPYGLPKKIIEVRCSETEAQSMEKFKRTPDDLSDEIIYIDASKDFNSTMVL